MFKNTRNTPTKLMFKYYS